MEQSESTAAPSPDPTPVVTDNAARSRFELLIDGDVVAIADYLPASSDGATLLLPHTMVDHDRRGQGLGEVLVRGALDQIRRRGQTIVPQCWYVAEFVDTHPEYHDLVAP